MNERANSKSLSNLTILTIFHRDFVVATRELNKEQICPEFDCCATFFSNFETTIFMGVSVESCPDLGSRTLIEQSSKRDKQGVPTQIKESSTFQ